MHASAPQRGKDETLFRSFVFISTFSIALGTPSSFILFSFLYGKPFLIWSASQSELPLIGIFCFKLALLLSNVMYLLSPLLPPRKPETVQKINKPLACRRTVEIIAGPRFSPIFRPSDEQTFN